ncbi:MAG: sulfatase-like hydrolase/transferase [Chloroflexi bacterium]|nr:sulfatase-like hydrolase/transferase [Chloroflexota bacterium]MYC48360.1 sulfatase-like hydrolase/transferase [Chloroflexota bacterium]
MRPNILVVMSDQHARRYASPYGHEFIRTPSMQRLADEGVTFENAYCNSPICGPSRASFMTGQYVPDVEAWDNATVLHSDLPTWAHLLNAAGYETVLSGKMHFQGADQLHGFQRRILSDVHGDSSPELAANWTGWLTETAAADLSMFKEVGPGEHPYSAYDEIATSQAGAYIRSRQGSKRPWALLVGLITPHYPFVVRPKFWDLYFPDHADLPEVPAHKDDLHPHNRRLAEWFSFMDVPIELAARARAGYYGLISYTDACLGSLLDAVDQSGQADETVVVYTSDHGEGAGEHGMWNKHNFYENSVGVPLQIRWPDRIPPRTRVAQPVSLVDLTRTIVDAAGSDAPDHWTGNSLLPLAEGQAVEGEGLVISDFLADGSWSACRMVRAGNLKYNYYHGEPEELFDLGADPVELNDQSSNPAYAKVLQRMRAIAMARFDPEEVTARVLLSQQKRNLIRAGCAFSGSGPWTPGNP